MRNGTPPGERTRVAHGPDAAHDCGERESDRHRQRRNIDHAHPSRRRAYGRQRRADKVERQNRGDHIRRGGTLEKLQDRRGRAHDQHGVDEQHSAAAVDGPTLLHEQSREAENNGERARGNVNRQEHVHGEYGAEALLNGR